MKPELSSIDKIFSILVILRQFSNQKKIRKI